MSLQSEDKIQVHYAVIQFGYCIFGVGATEQDALEDALQWLEEYETVESLKKDLRPLRNAVHGDLGLLSDQDEEFSTYMKIDKICTYDNGKWYL